MNIADALQATPVSSLDLTRHVTVATDASVATTVGAMTDAKRSCACVVDGDRLVGIFTQRDFLMRVVGRRSTWDRPIEDEMTRAVRTMRNDQTAADGLAIMNDWWVRSVPVVDDGDHLVGNLSFYTIIATIGNLLKSRIESDPESGPGIQDGLEFVDFTGMNTHTPVSVSATDTIETAVHHMRNRAIGSLLVTDERDSLVGTITEFDLLTRIGCARDDLDQISVAYIMTPDPIALSSRSSIADAIQEMIENEFSHLPLVGASGKPVGVTSVRDIATFIETTLETMG